MYTHKEMGTSLLLALAAILTLVGCVPSLTDDSATFSKEPLKKVFPEEDESEIISLPMETILAKVNAHEVLTPSQKIDAISRVADLHVARKENVQELISELKTNASTGSIVTNDDPLFLLRQVYVGSYIDSYYPDETVEGNTGFAYYQIARDLYRGTLPAGSDFINSNLEQIKANLPSFSS